MPLRPKVKIVNPNYNFGINSFAEVDARHIYNIAAAET
jgi:hypothetical protein